MFKIYIRKDHVGNLAFSMFTYGHQINEQWLFGPATRISVPEGEMAKEPTFLVPNIMSSEFMLALKDAIREFEGSTPDFSQGELKATKSHLEDMRKLVFEGLQRLTNALENIIQ
jgi:hypothetical protein